MTLKTIEWKNRRIKIIDQTKLPHKLTYVFCDDDRSLWHAVRSLKVRGAPALGIAAGLGIYVGIRDIKCKDYKSFKAGFEKTAGYIGSSRPTAVNLFWAIDRMRGVVEKNRKKSVSGLKGLILKEALAMIRQDGKVCRQMGKNGSRLIKNGDSILTHCNTGVLATADYGTALGAVYKAKKEGKRVRVYVDETRPLLQGARLTAWELLHNKIDATLICDNTAATLMAQGKIDKVFVGADRIARNGDVANKIGTYNLAVLAKYHGVPFYVVAPLSSFDLTKKNGGDIPIEQRGKDEVRSIMGRQTAPKNIDVYNPAFDVTPNGLVTAIVTERGIIRKPSSKTLKTLCKKEL